MKSKKSLLFLVPFLLLIFTIHAFAHDTDLYVGASSSVKPNILIIFDKSGSMGDPLSGIYAYCPDSYDPWFNYPQPSGKTYIDPNKVYKKGTSDWFPLNKVRDCVYSSQCGSYVQCPDAQNDLMGWGRGYSQKKWANSGCTTGSGTIATGNWLRFNYADASNKITCNPKIGIAKQVIKDLIDDVQGVRMGVMTFNPMFTASDGYSENEGGYILEVIKDLDESTNKTNLKNKIDTLTAGGWTPLAETLYEAGLYFQGISSYFNPGTTYTSPINPYCQKNYVIIMTDGMSTKDQNSILDTAIKDQNSDAKEPPARCTDPNRDNCDEGSDYLDDVAKYLYDTDLRLDLEKVQNIVTYTIGFDLDNSVDEETAKAAKDLLSRTATLSHGKFYTTENSAGLADAFTSILNEVLAKTSSFVAPIVPVSRFERTTAGDKIYLALFKPKQTGMWSGNIKKYGVAQADNPSKGIVLGDILDASGSKAVDSKGEFYPSSKSYWTTSKMDGGEVEIGGVGEVLRNRDFTSNPRKIFSYLTGCPTTLTESCNEFTTTNSNITRSLLDVATDDEKNKLINFVRGIDSYDDNLNGDYTDKRDWLLGSFLHSRPNLIFYPDRTVIYAGANDGMLHAFDDGTGEELWAYIPGSLLGNLKLLHTDNPPVFVDGSPKAYVRYDSDGKTVLEAFLIFGLRRGGYRYYALDVKDPLNPKFAWHIDGDISGYEEMKAIYHTDAQTWSTPVIGKVKVGTEDKWVTFIGGGYDVDQDNDNPIADAVGRAVYVVDVKYGTLVKRFSHAEYSNMTYSVPSDITKLDINGDGYVDRLYVGDMNGRIWRFDIGDSDKNKWQGNIIFYSNPGASEKRKIFYPPDITLEREDGVNYEMLFFGTGNREDPKGNKDIDRIYAVKDKNSGSASGWTNLGEINLVDVTNFYTDATVRDKIYNDKTKYGWYIKLDKQGGEKCLASPMVYAKVGYYTTFAPTAGSETDPCFIGEGTGYLYEVNYKTGEAVLNLDGSLDGAIGKSDRSVKIGTAIPSGVVVTVIGGKIVAYAGVGGGVYRVNLTDFRSLFPLHWKLVF